MIRKVTESLKIPEGFLPYISFSAVRRTINGISYLWWRMLTAIDNKAIQRAKIKGSALNKDKRNIIVTASLTSFPARIQYVHLAIKSIMQQTCKPDRIILWLANEQFPDHQLPNALTDLEQYGLEIKWCDDLYGHKKYFYCIKEQQPNEVVITFDDDIIYSVDVIKRLMEKHKEYPHCLVCERAQAIDYEANGKLKNPGRWKTLSNLGCNEPTYSLNPSPGGGCLIPYHAFYLDAYEKDEVCDIAYKNDDLWYMFMAAENGTRIVKTHKYHKTFSIINGTQTIQMATDNILNDKNIIIMKRLAEKYPKAFQRILTDRE